jgi:hypothetical protein
VIASAQLPVGLLTALIGTPYSVWLLWRSRTTAMPRLPFRANAGPAQPNKSVGRASSWLG